VPGANCCGRLFSRRGWAADDVNGSSPATVIRNFDQALVPRSMHLAGHDTVPAVKTQIYSTRVPLTSRSCTSFRTSAWCDASLPVVIPCSSMFPTPSQWPKPHPRTGAPPPPAVELLAWLKLLDMSTEIHEFISAHATHLKTKD